MLLQDLYGLWRVFTPAIGGYWIHADEHFPYHPIVLAYHGYHAEVNTDGTYTHFLAPTDHVFSAYKHGELLAVPNHPTRCLNSGKRVPSRRENLYVSRSRGGYAYCNECQSRVRIEYGSNKSNAWLYSVHEPKDYYRELPASFSPVPSDLVPSDDSVAPF